METLKGYDRWLEPPDEGPEGAECAVCDEFIYIDDIYVNRVGLEVCECHEHVSFCQMCGERVEDDRLMVYVDGAYHCPTCQMARAEDWEGVEACLPW